MCFYDINKSKSGNDELKWARTNKNIYFSAIILEGNENLSPVLSVIYFPCDIRRYTEVMGANNFFLRHILELFATSTAIILIIKCRNCNNVMLFSLNISLYIGNTYKRFLSIFFLLLVLFSSCFCLRRNTLRIKWILTNSVSFVIKKYKMYKIPSNRMKNYGPPNPDGISFYFFFLLSSHPQSCRCFVEFLGVVLFFKKKLFLDDFQLEKFCRWNQI